MTSVAGRARGFGGKVSEHALDVADEAAVKVLPDSVLAGYWRVAFLGNNAGVALGGTFEQVPPEGFNWVSGINFLGRRLHHSRLAPGGCGADRQPFSVFGIVARPGQVAYSASTFAVRGFSEALRFECRPDRRPSGRHPHLGRRERPQ